MSDMPPPPSEPDAASADPPAPMSPPPSAAPAPVAPPPGPGSVGPLGQSRSAGLVILLSIITLGIWPLVWSYQNGSELKRHTNAGFGGVAFLLLTFFVYPVTMFVMASEVEQLYRRRGLNPPITTIWGLWFLLPLIGNLIWYVRIQSSINDYWNRVAAAPAAA